MCLKETSSPPVPFLYTPHCHPGWATGLVSGWDLPFPQVLIHLSASGKIVDDNIHSLFFGDYFKPDSDPKIYDEITDLKQLTVVMEYYLDEFNNISKAPMSLVMFRFAIEHISRICRVLKQDKGHLLLVGIGGSGRQSATKLSTFMNSYELYQIEITKNYSSLDWREDLKKIMLQVGVATKSTVFLFTDNQVKDESFVEDINMLLNTGDVPNIFPADEKADLIEKMQTAARTAGEKIDVTPLSMYNFFTERVKKNLHIVLGKKGGTHTGRATYLCSLLTRISTSTLALSRPFCPTETGWGFLTDCKYGCCIFTHIHACPKSKTLELLSIRMKNFSPMVLEGHWPDCPRVLSTLVSNQVSLSLSPLVTVTFSHICLCITFSLPP